MNGFDYPVGFVRWTEQRNFEAVLDMLADGRLDVKPLISHRFALERAAEAYDLLASGGAVAGDTVAVPYAGGTVGCGNAGEPGAAWVSGRFAGCG